MNTPNDTTPGTTPNGSKDSSTAPNGNALENNCTFEAAPSTLKPAVTAIEAKLTISAQNFGKNARGTSPGKYKIWLKPTDTPAIYLGFIMQKSCMQDGRNAFRYFLYLNESKLPNVFHILPARVDFASLELAIKTAIAKFSSEISLVPGIPRTNGKDYWIVPFAPARVAGTPSPAPHETSSTSSEEFPV